MKKHAFLYAGLFTSLMILLIIPHAASFQALIYAPHQQGMKITEHVLPELFRSQHLIQSQQLQFSLYIQSPGWSYHCPSTS